MAGFTVKKVAILDDTKNPVNPRTGVLGLNVRRLNVRIELGAVGADPADAPEEIPFQVMSFEPGYAPPLRARGQRRPDKSTMTSPVTRTAKRQDSGLVYEASPSLYILAPFMKAVDSLVEIATVRRDGGTSDGYILNEMPNWARRGSGVQPTDSGGPVTGDPQLEQPDALTLFQAGGVEVLEVQVPAQANLDVVRAPKAWAYVRSPADVFFYTGHGFWKDGNLLASRARHVTDEDMRISGHWYRDWLSPETLLQYWQMGSDFHRSPMDLDALVINGCGVLSDNIADGQGKSCAARWAELLFSKQGPLYVILGYRDLAPLDSDKGNWVAKQLGKALATFNGDYESLRRKWLEINRIYKITWNAAALSSKDGYSFIDPDTGMIKEGQPIP
jgi:hypothetical protein